MASIRKQGIRNTIITYSGVMIGFVSLLFIQPNLLQPEELGLTRILIAAASLIATIIPLGVTNVTAKFFPYFRDEHKKHHGYFGLMLLFPLVGAILCGILIYSFKGFIISQYAQQSFLFTQYFDLLLPFGIIIGLNMVLAAYSAALFKTVLVTFFESILVRLLFIALVVIYYFQGITISQFMNLFVMIYLLQSLFLLFYIIKVDKPSLKIDFHYLKTVGKTKIFKYALLLTITSFSSISLKHLDTIMIGKYISLEQVGVFAVAAYIALIIEIPMLSLERITHPKIAQAWANKDLESIRNIYAQSVKYLMLGGGLLLIGIVINIKELLTLLPEIYQNGAVVAIIACVGGFVNIATGVNNSIIYTSDKYSFGAFLLLGLFIMAIGLNMLLIPTYGIEGAAFATALSMLIYNGLKYLIIWKYFNMQPFDRSSIKILMLIIVVLGIGVLIPEMGNAFLSITLKSLILTFLYLTITYWLKIVPEFHHYLPFKKK